MASGFMQRFKGKIAAAQLWITKGSIYDSASGIAGSMQMILRIPLPVTAAATTDYHIAIPPGATILSAAAYTTTAYGAVTDAKVSLGATDGGQDYIAQTSIKAVGIVQMAFVNAAPSPANLSVAPALAGGPPAWNFSARVTQSGGNSATGAAVLEIEYAL